MKKTRTILEETELRTWQHTVRNNHETVCDTLGDLSRCWLKNRYNKVKQSTFSSYRYCVQSHILPGMGEKKLADLDGAGVLDFIAGLQRRGLADSTVHSVLIALKAIIKYGVQSGLVKEELLEYCFASYRRPESRVLTVQDSIRMKKHLLEQNDIFSISVLLCRSTGMRIGELCGLKWGDIDFSANSIRIRRTVSRISNPDNSPGQPKTVLYIRPPKSYTSAREIPIPRYLLTPLKNMRKAENTYLLTGKENCTEPRNVQKKFKTILRDCEMQDFNFHALRHGFATACLENGVDCKTVSSILGHSSTHITMDFYVHSSMRQKQNCIDGII